MRLTHRSKGGGHPEQLVRHNGSCVSYIIPVSSPMTMAAPSTNWIRYCMGRVAPYKRRVPGLCPTSARPAPIYAPEALRRPESTHSYRSSSVPTTGRNAPRTGRSLIAWRTDSPGATPSVLSVLEPKGRSRGSSVQAPVIVLCWRLPEGRSERDPQACSNSGSGRRRLQPAGRADEDRTLARLRGLRSDLIDPSIAAHHGRIVKRTGDCSIIEFRSVVDAVGCAVEAQNGFAER